MPAADIIPFTYRTPSLSLAANSRGTVILNMTQDSAFEWHALFALGSVQGASTQSPESFSAQIKDEGSGYYFSNDLVIQSNLCGSAFNGVLMKRPVTFAPLTILSFDVQNLTAETNAVTFALTGYKCLNQIGYQSASSELMLPFVYRQRSTLTALGSDSVNLNLHGDSDFLLESYTAWSDQTAAGDTNPSYFTLGLTDIATGRQLTNDRVPQSLLCGSMFNGSWQQRRDVRFLPNSQIRLDLTDTSNATNVVEFAMHGYKVFPR